MNVHSEKMPLHWSKLINLYQLDFSINFDQLQLTLIRLTSNVDSVGKSFMS